MAVGFRPPPARRFRLAGLALLLVPALMTLMAGGDCTRVQGPESRVQGPGYTVQGPKP